MINRLRLALALALPLAAFVQSGSSVGALPALLPQEEGYEEQRAAAEGLVQEGSWQLALELYTRIDLSGLAEEDRRWVSFRLADLEWRSAAASRNPDPSRLDAGQRALRELAAPDARPADRDRVWAEVQESLGASHLLQRSFNWNEGLRLTRLAMDWWVSAADVETARERWTGMLWRMARPSWWQSGWRYGSWGNILPADLLEDALKVVETDVDRARVHLYLAQGSMQVSRGAWWSGRTERDLLAAIELSEGSEWFDDALIAYADWLKDRGRWVRHEDGHETVEVDYKGALALYQRLLDSYQEGSSPHWRSARQSRDWILSAELNVSVGQAFLPGSKVAFQLSWRNLSSIELSIHEIDMPRALRFQDPDQRSSQWLQQLDLGGSEQEARWTHETTGSSDHRGREETVALGEQQLGEGGSLAPGAYVLLARSGELERRELLLVSDAALVMKTTARRALVWAVGARDGRPIEGAEVALWARRYDGNWAWSVTRGRTDADGLLDVALGASASRVELVAVMRTPDGRRSSFALARGNANNPSRGWRVYAVTDRPAYRPGQEVRWKATLRQYTDLVYVTPGDEPVQVTISGPRGDEVAKLELTTNEFGSVWGSLETTASMALGEYRARFSRGVGGAAIGSATLFRLEEYKLPEFEVSVSTPEEDGRPKIYVLGDEVELEVQARTYFGAPVANAEVELVVYQNSHAIHWPLHGRYAWFERSLRGEPSGISRGWGRGQEVLRRKLRTDALGRARMTHAVDPVLGRDLEFTVNARVVDSARREVTGVGKVRVTRQSYAVRATSEERLFAPGRAAAVTFEAKDSNDHPVQVAGTARLLRGRWFERWQTPEGREVTRRVYELERQRRGIAPAGWVRTQGEYRFEELREVALETDAQGRATWDVVLPDEGAYVVRWTSEDARASAGGRATEVMTELWIWALDERTRDLGYHIDGLGLVLDASSFQAGSPGHVMIVAESSGRHVLFTVEAEEIIEHRVVKLDGTVKLLEFDLDDRHIPNIHLDVRAVEGGRLLRASQDVIVPPASKFLEVAVELEKDEYRPGEEEEVVVRVTSSDGEPVRSEVSVSLVDESLLAIQTEYAGDPRQFFWGHRRGSGVQDGSTFRLRSFVRLIEGEGGRLRDERLVLVEKETLEGGADYLSPAGSAGVRLEALGYASADALASTRSSLGVEKFAGRGMEMRGRAPGEEAGAPAVVVRSDFRETALWLPSLVTDESGRASSRFEFPDSTTRWRATARATGRGAEVGWDRERTVRTTLPLVVRLQAPRFFVEGDEVTISAVLNNNSDSVLSVDTALVAEGLAMLGWFDQAGRLEQGERPAIVVPGGEERRIDWRVRAEAPGQATMTVTAVAGDEADGMRRSYPIHERGVPVLEASAGKLDGAELVHTFQLPAEREHTEVSVTLAPSLAVTMLDALPYLIDFPYGCTEQTLSRFVPAVVAQKTLTDLGLDPSVVFERSFGGIEEQHTDRTQPRGRDHAGELERVVQQGLERIASTQRGDGGWGWWPGGEANRWMTAYAVWSLALARDAGLDVPSSMLERGASWLALHMVEAERQADEQAYLLFSYASWLGGRDVPAAHDKATAATLENLWSRKDSLNAYSRALFALAAGRLGREGEARQLVRSLASGAIHDEAPGQGRIGGARGGHQEATVHWGEDGLYWRWSEGGVEATAFCLMAMLEIDPDNELVEPALTWLVRNRRGAQWKSTRDTAICVLSMCDWLRHSGELSRAVGYSVEVNGEELARVELSAQEALAGPSRFRVPNARDGANRVVIKRTSGEGPLYWGVEARFFSSESRIPARGSHLFVRRDFYRLVERPTLLGGAVFDRVPLGHGDGLESGERVEVVLTLEAKSHLEYLMIEDLKAAGLEATELRSGEPFHAHELRSDELARRFDPDAGAVERLGAAAGDDRASHSRVGRTGRSRWVYRELRDRKVALFLDSLPQGVWEMRYTLRAEVPGTFHTLPALGSAMYVPEIRGNSEGLQLVVTE